MRILSMIVLVAVSVVSFLPCLWAGESAGLSLTVTFAVDEPPVWVIEPVDKTNKAGETLTIEVLARDPENAVITYDCRWWLNGVRQDVQILPKGATFVWKSVTGENPKLTWIIPITINLTDVHEFEFSASDSQSADQGNTISKKIRVTLQEGRIISVEINNPTWNLEGVKLNERRNNNDPVTGLPLHMIKNAGNVPILVEIGYYSGPSILPLPGTPQPGLIQGIDKFITMVGTTILPLAPSKLRFASIILPGQSAPVPLILGTPTALSTPVTGFHVEYEIRAYSVVIP